MTTGRGRVTHQGQKWSKASTQRSVMAQCFARSGRTILQLTHNCAQLPAHSAGESSCLLQQEKH